jgi:hypothetical protein
MQPELMQISNIYALKIILIILHRMIEENSFNKFYFFRENIKKISFSMIYRDILVVQLLQTAEKRSAQPRQLQNLI